MKRDALSDVAIRQTKSKRKPIKLLDGRGLYLEVCPTGSKLWRYRYRNPASDEHGKRKETMLSLGEYPEVSLSQARADRDAARKLIKQGIHPARVRKAEKHARAAESANTFEAVAREWLTKKGKNWKPRNRDRIERALEREAFPTIGKLPIRSVTPAHLLAVMQKVEAKGSPTIAVLVRQWAFRIFNHAIANLKADSNPAAGEIRDAIQPPAPKSHPPLQRTDIPALDAALAGYAGERTTVIALRLLMLTFVRSVELRGAEWSEFDLDRAEWRVPRERMKMGESHIVPLSRQAVAFLRELYKLTGRQRFLFPNARRPGSYMASTTLNAALVRLGYKHRFSPHGFRSTASTMLNELGVRADWIERQLAHKSQGVRAIYNQAQYLAERRTMMQQWADLLAEYAKGDGKVLPMKSRRSR
jgi:integrase